MAKITVSDVFRDFINVSKKTKLGKKKLEVFETQEDVILRFFKESHLLSYSFFQLTKRKIKEKN